MPLRCVAFPALLCLASLAFAQAPPRAVARATIESVSPDGASLTVRTRAGEEETVRIRATRPASFWSLRRSSPT